MTHLLLVPYPTQGMINPTLQLAKCLSHRGVRVTVATTVYAHGRMALKPSQLHGVCFATFSDGCDDGVRTTGDSDHYTSRLEEVGSRTLAQLLDSLATAGYTVSGIVYDFFLPWVSRLSQDLQIPCTVFWTQPFTLFAIYYHYFHGSFQVGDTFVKLPGLPLLTSHDLPSFFLPENEFASVLQSIAEMFELLKDAEAKRVLINSFDALEGDALGSVQELKLLGIGPLIPSAFLDGKDPSDTAFGGDLWEIPKTCTEWLSSKPPGSVVYVSFGSLAVISHVQMDKIARGLSESNRPFLWVVRQSDKAHENQSHLPSGFEEEMAGRGLVVGWCNQVEVLSHVAVGCFVTHSGWNSTLEGLVTGVPMVCFPVWSDQPTNAKLVMDVWRTGVRATVNGDGVLEGEELKRCLTLVMEGESGREMRMNAAKWSGLAKKAAEEGGSSDCNIQAFVDDVSAQQVVADC